MTQLHWLTVTEVAKRYKDRQLSPVELLQALLARIEQVDPKLNVFSLLDADAAMAAASKAEAEIMAGRLCGPLHGIPVGIKDIVDVAGLPTTCYSKILNGNVATMDSTVVARLRQAGAIILGKTATHEFAIGGPSFELPFPPARNPWNRDCHPGGSSSGSAAGIAAGFFPSAIGSDTGGSIRNPASACGIVGVKPTYDLVSRRGVFPLAFTLDHVGPMCRTVADAGLMLDAMAGCRQARAPVGDSSYCSDLSRGIRGLRVGFVRHFHEADIVANPEVSRAIDEAAVVLEREGADIRVVALPNLNQFIAVNRIIYMAEAWSIHAPWLRTRPGDYCQLSRRRLLGGAFLSAGDYVNAQRRRRQLIAATQEVFKSVDILLTANAMDPPCRIDSPDDLARTYPRQARTPFNVTGHPAMAMMSGLSRDGLPLGIQLVAPYWQEATMLRVGAVFERATDWHNRHPLGLP